MSQDLPAFSALWAARPEAMVQGRAGRLLPSAVGCRGPRGWSPPLGGKAGCQAALVAARASPSTLDPSPDHGHPLEEPGTAGRGGPGGLVEARFGKQLPGWAQRPSGAAPGRRPPHWPVGGGHTWGTRASRQLWRGSWRSSRMGAVGPAGPQCARLVSLCLRACGQGCSRALLQAAGGGEGGIVPATHGEQALLNSSWGLPGGGGSEGREGCVRLQAAVDAGWEPSRTGSS